MRVGPHFGQKCQRLIDDVSPTVLYFITMLININVLNARNLLIVLAYYKYLMPDSISRFMELY